jgi:cation:H+ antiporter
MVNLLFWIGIWAASLFLIIKSASYAIEAIIKYARKTGLSNYFVGFMIVSIGTTLPEIFTAIIASLEGSVELILGDAIGASVVDITLVLGFVAIVSKKLKISGKSVNLSIPRVMAVLFLPVILALDGAFSRNDGIFMILAFVAYYGLHFKEELGKQKIKKTVSFRKLWKHGIVFGINIALLIFGSQLLVLSSKNIAIILNMPMYIFGALILSICTTSPEFFVELKAIKNKASPIAIGDIFGSVICNTSLVLGIAFVLAPVTIDKFFFFPTMAFMIIVVLLGLLFIQRGEINWKEGILLLSIYLVFILLQILLL